MIDVIQGTAEWLEIRRGKVTASRVADVLAKTKAGWGASRANYMAQLVAERLTGTVAESYQSAEMRWGAEHEAEAKAAYSFLHDVEIVEVGFVDHPSIPMAGASPDGLLGVDGLIEIKCPNTATHLDWLLGDPIPGKYISQMQWQMACTGREWCDFVSFDPRVPEAMRLFRKRVPRDQAFIDQAEAYVREFLAELAAKVDALSAIYGGEA